MPDEPIKAAAAPDDAQKIEPAPAEPQKAEPASDEAQNDAPMPFPKLDAQLQTDSIEKDEHGNELSITYFANADEPGKRDKLEAQIREAGFSPIPNGDNTNYEKVQGNQIIMIQITEGEGELQIDMTRTRDPQNRYKDADTRIPYPLDRGFAAEYGDQMTGDNGEVIYTYFNRPPEFLSNYETRLQNDGFTKARDDDSPLYHKILSDSTELVVLILKLNERGTDMRILMNAVAPK